MTLWAQLHKRQSNIWSLLFIRGICWCEPRRSLLMQINALWGAADLQEVGKKNQISSQSHRLSGTFPGSRRPSKKTPNTPCGVSNSMTGTLLFMRHHVIMKQTGVFGNTQRMKLLLSKTKNTYAHLKFTKEHSPSARQRGKYVVLQLIEVRWREHHGFGLPSLPLDLDHLPLWRGKWISNFTKTCSRENGGVSTSVIQTAVWWSEAWK